MTSTQTQPAAISLLKEFMAEAEKFVAENGDKPAVDPKYVVTAEFVEVPSSEYKPLTDKLRKAEAKLAKAKAEVEAAKRPIAELMAGAEVLVDADTKQYIVESRVSVGQIFDATRFKKEQPDTAAKFMRDRYSRSFRLLG